MYKNRINYKLLNFLILMGLLYICVTNIGTWFQIFLKVFNVCFPFILAFAISYALYPLVKKLEEKGVRKSIAIFAIVFLVFSILIFLLSMTLPLLYNQLVSFASSIGTVIEGVSEKFDLNLTNVESITNDYLNHLIGSLGNILKDGTIDIVGKTVSILGQSIIVIVVTIYFLSYMDKIREEIKGFLKHLKN